MKPNPRRRIEARRILASRMEGAIARQQPCQGTMFLDRPTGRYTRVRVSLDPSGKTVTRQEHSLDGEHWWVPDEEVLAWLRKEGVDSARPAPKPKTRMEKALAWLRAKCGS